MPRTTLVVALTIAFVLAIACGPARKPIAPSVAPSTRDVTSNVVRADYAGSESCKTCHQDLYDRWMKAPMHGMTRLPDGSVIRAPFDGTIFRFKSDRVKLERYGERRYMRIETEKGPPRIFRITKVIGGRRREDFAGLEVVSTEAGAKPVVATDSDRILPVSFMIDSGALRYKGYSVMERERPGLRASGQWSKRCIFCHNTVPYLDVMFGALAGEGTPPYQGEVVDWLLPKDRRWSFEVTDASLLREALVKEILFLNPKQSGLGGGPEKLLPMAVSVTRAHFDQAHLLEIGIGCESCHGGSREHVDDPSAHPVLEPRAPFVRVKHGALSASELRAQRINRTCARCHQVLFSAYPFTWEGGLRAQANSAGGGGGSNINSGEGRDLLLGSCASAMSCATCHDPHEPDSRPRVAALEKGEADTICLSCHAKLKDEAAQKAHTHHDPKGEGGRCMSCHMPKKNMSLSTGLSRYHRIGSPNDKTKVERDRPLECALCHHDKTVRTLVDQMEAWWPDRTFDRKALEELYGGLDENPMLFTLGMGKAHEQAVAIWTVGDKRFRPAVPYLARLVTHPYPILRYYVVQALERIFDDKAPFDLHRENADITKDARAWIASKGFALPKE